MLPVLGAVVGVTLLAGIAGPALEAVFASTNHVLSEPNPAIGSNVDAYANPVEGRTGQVNAMPACWRLVDHAFLYSIDSVPRRWIGSREGDVLAAIAKARESLIGDTRALVEPIGAGMAEAAVNHIPTVQAGTAC